MIRYGAKAIPEGGLHAMPRFYADGLCIVGDSAGFLNGLRLKGIHLAMKSGMMAAEAIFDAVQAGDTSRERAQRVRDEVRATRGRAPNCTPRATSTRASAAVCGAA